LPEKSGIKKVATHTTAKTKSAKNSLSDLERGKFLLELYQKALLLSEKELNDYFIDHAVNLTQSSIGFFHFISEDQKSIILTAWNVEALKDCVANYIPITRLSRLETGLIVFDLNVQSSTMTLRSPLIRKGFRLGTFWLNVL
jgi:hypothetical protein